MQWGTPGRRNIRLKAEANERRAKRKVAAKKTASAPAASDYICGRCGRVCCSRIGLSSHERKCWSHLKNNKLRYKISSFLKKY